MTHQRPQGGGNQLHSFKHYSSVAACTAVTAVHSMQIYANPDGPGLAGKLFKAVYREYTEATFSKRLPAPAQHGILGPILHARIGDSITIVFKVSPALSWLIIIPAKR